MKFFGLFEVTLDKVRTMERRGDLKGLSKVAGTKVDNLVSLGVRVAAVEALGRVSRTHASSKTVTLLAEALRDGPPVISTAALEALAAIAAHGTIEAETEKELLHGVLSILRTSKDEMRELAASVLAALGWSPSSPEDSVLYAIARHQYEPLRDLGEMAVTAAAALLRSRNITGRQYEEILVTFPSAESVAYLCHSRNYQALSIIRQKDKSFDGQIYEDLVKGITERFSSEDYVDQDTAKALVGIGHPAAATHLKKALDRGLYETDTRLKNSIAEFVRVHSHLCGPVEKMTCHMCHLEKNVTDMQFFTTKAEAGSGKKYQWFWFCKGQCWNERGKLFGSRMGEGCPYWNDGVCKASDDNYPCSLELKTHTQCFVYKTKREGPSALAEGLPGAWR